MSPPVTACRRSLGFAVTVLTVLTVGAVVLAAVPAAFAAPTTSVPLIVSQPSASLPAARPLTATPIPTITGTPQAGRRLTASPGTWKPAPVALSYRWKVNGVAARRSPRASDSTCSPGRPTPSRSSTRRPTGY